MASAGNRILLRGGRIVSGGRTFEGGLSIEDGRISGIFEGKTPDSSTYDRVVELDGRAVMAGGIDPHVHFREPGMTHKADIASESRAALLGGVTSCIDMPNNIPPAVTPETMRAKLELANGRSSVNYSFHYGITDSNIDTVEAVCRGENPVLGSGDFAGLKLFMGSSTGNMLVSDSATLDRTFALCGRDGRSSGVFKRLLVHCEDEGSIRSNMEEAVRKFGDDIPFRMHPEIRSRQACMKSSMRALEMAINHGTALELCHVSTNEEMQMCRAAKYNNPLVAAETSPNYLWFSDEDYDALGGKIKCNPAVKKSSDRDALRHALIDGTLDIIGTDHAPHLLQEKDRPYALCPSGIPSIQHSLPVLLTLSRELDIPLERISEVFSVNPARAFGIKDRGVVAIGAYADLVVADTDREYKVESGDLAYKCGWSPYEGCTFTGHVDMVFVNGVLVVEDGALTDVLPQGRKLEFSFDSK